jgi:hypothetical protein
LKLATADPDDLISKSRDAPVSKADKLSHLALRFARQLGEIRCISGSRVDEFDAINVNASISMVAEETNGLSRIH